jgi:hypothetical protein
MIDIISLHIGFETPIETLEQFQDELKTFLRAHPLHFYPKAMVLWNEISNMNRMKVRIRIQHRGNFQNQYQFRLRKQMVMEWMKETLERLEIKYELPIQHVEVADPMVMNAGDGTQLPPPPPSIASQFHVGGGGFGIAASGAKSGYGEGLFDKDSPYAAIAEVLDGEGMDAQKDKKAKKKAAEEEKKLKKEWGDVPKPGKMKSKKK